MRSGLASAPDELTGAIRQAVAETAGEAIERLRAAVRIPSVNPSVADGDGEGALQRFVAAELRALGCRVETWEPDADALAARFPHLRATMRAEGFRDRPNVIGWIPSEEPPRAARAHLILNSHADTVAPGDAAAWRYPPFSATVDDGTLWGLGAVDAKGCLFAFLGAAAALRAAGIRLKRSVMIQSVVDEESGGAGVLECIRRGYTAGAAIVGEPSGLRVCPASRGAMGLHLRVSGRKAHPGEGWRGVNAIRKAWLYVEALDRLRDDLDRTRMHPLWAGLPAGHVWNLMGISAGAVPAGRTARSVPDLCEVNYGIGLIGDQRPETMRPVVEEALGAVTAGDPWLTANPPAITWLPGAFEPAVTDPSHPAVIALAEAAAVVTGAPVRIEAFSAATDGRHLTNAGGIPAVNFGPGPLHLGHSPLEALPVAEFRAAIEIVALCVARYCGIASTYC
jgi:acetylornithine deacetylase